MLFEFDFRNQLLQSCKSNKILDSLRIRHFTILLKKMSCIARISENIQSFGEFFEF